ncbi:MAG: hypothetical protein KGN00_09610 [Chloroflexota bacterium]|nr:hypothetical protein [Chloroflexota bacterium]MDE3193930.1 hypothetical protein [Chloroflexota bacterium]
MRLLRAIRPWAIVFLVGGMLSFVVTALGSGLAEEKAIFGVHESSAARQYMISLLENEPQSLISLLPKTDVVSRALQFAQSESAAGQIRPISLTYLGGRTSGSLSVFMYAIEVRADNGQRQFFPLALTLSGGRVIRRE